MAASDGRPLRDAVLAGRARVAFPTPEAACGAAPPASLAQWRRYFDYLCASPGFPSSPQSTVPAAVPFLFASEDYPEHHLPHEHIPVAGQAPIRLPAAHLWWLASAGDHVLLHGPAHPRHLRIGSVERAAGSLNFDDPWSSSPGRLPLGATAAGFERDAVLLATFDTPTLLERYLEAFPGRRGVPRLLNSFGGALLGSGIDELAPLAACYFDQALLAALLAPAHERECIAAGLYLALTLSLHDARMSPEPLAARPFADRLYRLLLDHAEASLQQHLSPAQLCRLAAASARVQDMARASRLCQLAVNRDPSDAHTRLCRARLLLASGDTEAALADARAGLDANAQRLRELTSREDKCLDDGALLHHVSAHAADEARRLNEALEAILAGSGTNP